MKKVFVMKNKEKFLVFFGVICWTILFVGMGWNIFDLLIYKFFYSRYILAICYIIIYLGLCLDIIDEIRRYRNNLEDHKKSISRQNEMLEDILKKISNDQATK